jgi:hypothetical protein
MVPEEPIMRAEKGFGSSLKVSSIMLLSFSLVNKS